MKAKCIRFSAILAFSSKLARLSSWLLLATVPLSLWATPVPQNLGNGLDKLVESNLTLKAAQARGSAITTFNGYATQQAADYAKGAIMDGQHRPLVRIHLDGTVGLEQLRSTLASRFVSLKVTATDKNYRAGVIEGYISLDDVPKLAQTPGVRSVILTLKPQLRQKAPVESATDSTPPLRLLGTAFDQGVTQHRVDKINRLYNPSAPVSYTGAGISIGILSDSFDTAPDSDAGPDVTNGDLPGPGNPINTNPVIVLQDIPDGSDEGRGMAQICYKMAPKTRLGFATAFTGEVAFANNIRALAGLAGFTFPPAKQRGFAANVICDDVFYFDEPFFQDGIIGFGVDDVAAAGVAYFSSAGNDIGTNGYDSDLRIIPNGQGLTGATNAALRGTNINLSGVPPRFYQGGFHNFNPDGRDIAQLVNLEGGNLVVMQWDDPYDQTGGLELGPQIYMNSGTVTGDTPVIFDKNSSPPLPPLTAGETYVITEHQTSGDYDAIVSVIAPNGRTILTQDTGVDETVVFTAPVSGNYQFVFGRFDDTTGSFEFTLNTATIDKLVTTDLNLLVFNTNGGYLFAQSLHANNLATNEPIELGFPSPPPNQTQVQFVIARANIPAVSPKPASHVRYIIPGNGAPNLGPAEYFDYLTPSIHGHSMAQGCNGVAAYSVFRPSIPEAFTSPGPATIYFDKNNNRFPTPRIRQQPRVAAADGANTSFFVADTNRDGDLNPNFFGTSAAAPHAAAIAALVLQVHGGPGSVTPKQMTTVLQRSTFLHDLDPFHAQGVASTAAGGKITVSILSDNDSSPGTGEHDPNAIEVTYDGPGKVASLDFNSNAEPTDGGNVTGGNNGLDESNHYFSNIYPGLVFDPALQPFILGDLVGLRPGDVVATTSHPARAPSTGQLWTLNLRFPQRKLQDGLLLRFGIGRDEQHTARVGTFDNPLGGFPFAGPDSGTTFPNGSGDLWGGGVLIPEGFLIRDGMRFSGKLDDGSAFSGTMRNRIGRGYSVLDGYGFINAETAVSLPLP
jgi:subtilase family protein